MAVGRGEAGSLDLGARQTIPEDGLLDQPVGAGESADAFQHVVAKRRVRGAKPLMREKRVGDPPAVVDVADQILARYANVLEEDLGELFLPGDGPDRSDRDPRAREIDQEKPMPACLRGASGSVRASRNIHCA